MIDSNNIKKILGRNVKQLRTSKGLTQEQLAEHLNLQRETIAFIETGTAFVSSDVLASICNFFNVEPNFLFKSKYIEPTEKEVNLKKEINRLMSNCNEEKLEYIFNFVNAIKK